MLPQKEAIAEAVAKCGRDVLETASGRFLVKNIDLQGYTSNKERWCKQQSQRKERRDTFLKDMEIGNEFEPSSHEDECQAAHAQSGTGNSYVTENQDVLKRRSEVMEENGEGKKRKRSNKSEEHCTHDSVGVKGRKLKRNAAKKKLEKRSRVMPHSRA